jgi:sugar transferase (PEP-CTERM/EpsH1 system associated)
MRILWLKSELLHPVDKGGRIRTYNMLRELKREHHVTYLTLDDGTAAPDAMELAREYCHEVERIPFTTTPKDSQKLYVDLLQNLASPLPYAVAKYRSPAMTRRILQLVGEKRFDVVVCDFLFPSQNLPALAECPIVLFQHNVEAAIWERHYKTSASTIRRYYMREQWRRMARFERAECRRFHKVIAVSEADARTMEADYGLPHVAWVPTGVDTRYFAPSGLAKTNPREIVFTGAMDWLPNEDAIGHFVSAILPLVRRTLPDATFTVVGRNPTARIRQLAAATAGMEIAGSVPDVRPYVERGAVSIVPMRIGGGTRLKIYEAMALARPVVTTTIGAEGLPVTPDEHVLFADDAESFAAQVVRLLESPDDARALGARGAEFVRRNFGWERVSQQFAEICAEVVADAAGARRLSA